MFLLGIGEILEEWTHKKSVNDLARSMSINAEKVWFVNEDGQEVLISASSVKAGDLIRVHMGNVIPFDGNVVAGEAMVNQTSLTGESAPVRKAEGSFAYAGTVLEEGELTVKVKEAAGSSRYEKIVNMIEDSEKLKSSVESNAEHLADRLVPYTLAGTGITYLLTRNMTKTLAVLMVDFSCALKLAMPVSVLSAIREASTHSITVKGGKYMEAMADATTIVFDKTGTLTKAKPVVSDVVSFSEELSSDELLRIAACMEEHFPHSMARAVVNAAKEKHLVHEEMHSKVEYIVAHGISTTIEGKKAVIGSWHFVMEDEKCVVIIQDINDFKKINDLCGHVCGDKILIDVSRIMKEHYQKYGRVYRTGGDEFTVIMEKNLEDAKKITEEFIKKVEENVIIKNYIEQDYIMESIEKLPEVLSISYGISRYDLANKEKHDLEQVIKEADKEMYYYKRKRNQNK